MPLLPLLPLLALAPPLEAEAEAEEGADVALLMAELGQDWSALADVALLMAELGQDWSALAAFSISSLSARDSSSIHRTSATSPKAERGAD